MACQLEHDRDIQAQLLGELPAERWAQLRTHIAGCPSCRATYNRLAYAERLLAGGPAALSTPTPESLARVERAVLAETAPEQSVGVRVRGVFAAFFARPQRWVPAFAGGLAVLAGVLVLPRLLDEPRGGSPGAPSLAPSVDVEGFQPRGATTPKVVRASGIRVFCLEGSSVRAVGGAHSGDPHSGDAAGAVACPRAANLRFSVRNTGAYRFLFLVGVDETRALKWYAPRPPADASEPAPSGTAEEPVGRPLRIAVNHDPGALRVYALFSDTPLFARDVQGAVSRLGAGALPPALPLARDDVHQASLVVRIAP